MRKPILRLILLFSTCFETSIFPSVAQAFELEFFAGARSTTYEDASDANTSGVSLRTKFNFYQNHRGVFLNVNARGISLLASDFLIGYAWRSSGSFFLEGGPGFFYSPIYGSGVGLLGSIGYRLTSATFISAPLVIGNSGIFWTPQIGVTF